MDKVILIDKPAGWTSFDVVAKIRGAARRISGDKKIKVGHAGTLDPFATGLMIVLVGKNNTSKQASFMKQDKEYLATMKLGYLSTSGDPEGEITQYHPDNLLIDGQKITKEKILQVFSQYLGSIEQTPPIFSAVKIAGQRAYKLARAGKVPEMKSRQVFIYSLELVSYDFPELAFRVKCSSGTYVRSLAQDIGQDLGCGGYLAGLRRTMIGDYHISDAVTIEEALKSMED